MLEQKPDEPAFEIKMNQSLTKISYSFDSRFDKVQVYSYKVQVNLSIFM